jgi:DDE family transposase
MPFYPAPSGVASTLAQFGTVMVAVPVSALVWPVREGSTADGRSALAVAGAGGVRTGDVVVWCKIVAVAPAVVRRDGRLQAEGRPCDHARLGVLEEELDARCGPDTIEQVAAGVRLDGKIKGSVQRELSVAFVLRVVLLMTLMPEADQRQVMATLLGDLPVVPWRRAHRVPSGTASSTWRAAIGPKPVQDLQRQVLAAVEAEHRSAPAMIEVGGGLRVGAIDGTVTRMPDTPANRARFGTAGQAETGYPQIRHLHTSDAFTRSTLAALTGPAGGDKAEAEQALLDRTLTECPYLFTPDRLWIMDRNFPGVPRIAAMLATGTHVLIRVKSDIRLPRVGGYAPDGSYQARLSGGGVSLTVRVIEYHVMLDGATTAELFCLVTDLLDHDQHPAHLLAAAYRWRWDGSETALREAKSAINGAGPGTGAILRSATPDGVAQEHAAWIIATELVHALTRSAAVLAAPARKGPRAGHVVAARDLSFTAARRAAVMSTAAGTATASLPAPARTAGHHAALDALTLTRTTTDRHRHRQRKTKTRPPFAQAAARDLSIRTTPAHLHVCNTVLAATVAPNATLTDLHPTTCTPPDRTTEHHTAA